MHERIKYYDIARGIALFFVVAGHLFTAGNGIFIWIFSFHMPLFFMISGCCFRFDKYKSFSGFLKRKLKTLLLPYVVFSGVGFLITCAIPSWRTTMVSSAAEVLKQTFYYANPEYLHVGQLWFLACLFAVEILAYVVYFVLTKYQTDRHLCIAILCSAVFGALIIPVINAQIAILTNGFVNSLPFKTDVAFSALVFFLVGYILANNRVFDLLYKHKKYALPFFAVVNVMISTRLNGNVNIANVNFGENIFYYYIAAFSGCAVIMLISMMIKKNRVLQYYGRNSLHMFALHSFLLYLSAEILSRVLGYRVFIMENIPFLWCALTSVLIYAALFPVSVLYNKIKRYFLNFKKASI